MTARARCSNGLGWLAGPLAGLLLISATARAAPFGTSPAFDEPSVALVTATALAFMQPRTLEEVPLSRLTLWGLQSLTALDPKLQLEPDDRSVRLFLQTETGRRSVWECALPAAASADAQAWGRVIASGLRNGWNASQAVRRVGTQGVVQTFFDEVFNHLDPYSRYATPEEATAARDARDGQGDLGLRVAARVTGLLVTDVDAGGPAAQAGIRRGDRLVAIDDVPVSSSADTATATSLLAGPDGSDVRLTIRPVAGRSRALVLRRVTRIPETVFARRERDMAVVRVTGFSADTGIRINQELARAVSPVARRRIKGVVLDLRGNRGGLLDQAVVAAASLMDSGLVASTVGRDPASNRRLAVADGHDVADGLPVVVLVDGRTASAAEVLAAGLGDQRRAVVVGSATLGKGLVQTVAPLPDGGELYVSWSQIVAPAGWPLQVLGVLPRVCTSIGQEAARSALTDLTQGIQPAARPRRRHDDARAPLPVAEAMEIRSSCPAAEGRDFDLVVADTLIHTPRAYATALDEGAP